ncbi:vWA domain-containing protein [uncultured Ruminococcus sp.]|uniref:vWA domain-containing protein n=1 Tax=uncultured Ruminococcus sp. TaxID=165186 RepID=UPI0025DDA43F|nr:vWA domain-containing protein [uncultured Ruminococcus sp.]
MANEMMDLLDTTEDVGGIPRRTLTIFFMIDVSGSMYGSKIGAVNSAMEEVLVDLQDVEGADAEIKMAVLTFSDGCYWMTPQPVNLDANWSELKAEGLTDFYSACKELNDKLSVSHGFMDSASGCYAPVLFLITDGYPTDDTDNGDNGINLLKKNNWYKAAIRVAIAIGDDANKSLCENFTGNPETVVVAHNSVFLKKVIKKIAVTSSQVASSGRSRTDSETTDPNTVESTVGNKQVGTIIKEIPEDDDDDFEW